MKTIVIYKSKTGYVRKYAQWIAEELSADLADVSGVNLRRLEQYDTVIFGGSLHAVGINGIKKIRDNFDKLKDKNIVVFFSGASLPGEKVMDHVRNSNFTPEQQQRLRLYYMRGGFDYNRLPPFDKLLMTMMKKKIENKKRKNIELLPDDKGMLALFEKSEDYTDKDNIRELVAYVKSLEKS